MSSPSDPLVSAIADAVVARLGAGVPGPRLLTIEGAAIYLSMTVDSIRHKVTVRKIPVIRVDRFLRFDVRALDKWIEESRG